MEMVGGEVYCANPLKLQASRYFHAEVAEIKVAVDILLRSAAFRVVTIHSGRWILDISRELADRTLETSEGCKK